MKLYFYSHFSCEKMVVILSYSSFSFSFFFSVPLIIELFGCYFNSFRNFAGQLTLILWWYAKPFFIHCFLHVHTHSPTHILVWNDGLYVSTLGWYCAVFLLFSVIKVFSSGRIFKLILLIWLCPYFCPQLSDLHLSSRLYLIHWLIKKVVF